MASTAVPVRVQGQVSSSNQEPPAFYAGECQIPSTSDRILSQLGLAPVQEAAWVDQGTWGGQRLTHVVPGKLLFPRIEMVE